MIDYTGIQCPVCGKSFGKDDDIVVCPECGAPYHRECYQKAGHCIYEEKHGTPEAWQPPASAAKDAEEKRCPRCGKPNAPGALFCDHCGMSLTGEPPIGPQNNYGQFNSRYGAPPSPTDFPNSQQPPMGNTWGAYGQPQQNRPEGGNPQQPFQGPPIPFLFDPLGGVPADEKINGVPAGDVAKFVQANTSYYLPVFANQQKYGRRRFNFCAFLCTGGWMLYRKQYKLGAILTAVMAAIYLVSLYCSTVTSDMILQLMSQAGMDSNQAALYLTFNAEQFWQLLFQEPPDRVALVFLPLALRVVQLVIMVVVGFKANRVYMNFCTKKVQAVYQGFPEPSDRELQLRSRGGVNTPLAVCLMIAYMMITYAPMLFSLG